MRDDFDLPMVERVNVQGKRALLASVSPGSVPSLNSFYS